MRAFIAIDVNDEIRSACASLQSALKYSDADVKWVRPENIHLTLKFLGEINQEKCEEVKELLDKVAAQYKPFDISLFRGGAFPSLDHPKVIWLGIDHNCGLTEEIADKVDEACHKLGFEKEKRKFSAHLTLGRVNAQKQNTARARQALPLLKEKFLSTDVPQVTSRVESIFLYQSTLTPKGSIYRAIHRATLTHR